MTQPFRLAALAMAMLSWSLLVAETPVRGQQPPQQTPEDEAARQQAIARRFEQNAMRLTLFDRYGTVVGTVGERGLYNQPALSPDRTRIALVKIDLEAETADIWVVDVATGREVRLTANKRREPVASPIWSPDGLEVAYVAVRGTSFGIYRRLATGQGEEKELHQQPGLPIQLTDWTLDGRFISYNAGDTSGGAFFLLPVDGGRTPIELYRSTAQIVTPRFSPDGRFFAYRSNETGRNEIWVQARSQAGAPASTPDRWQISPDGGLGMMFWRRDGKELYYLAADRGLMAIEIDTSTGLKVGKPRRLFNLPDAISAAGNPGTLGNISRDGERLLFSIPAAVPRRQLTVFDRSGTIVSRVGEPGLYVQPSLSPDGSKVAVMKQEGVDGNADIWVFDVATGKSTVVTADTNPEDAPMWFDRDRVAYLSARGNYTAIYRKAWNGAGQEEMLFRYAPAAMGLTDISADGRFVMFDGGGVVAVVPLTGNDPLTRQSIDVERSEHDAGLGRFSPDGRYVAYVSDETNNRPELFVKRFDPKIGSAASTEKWQVTRDGVLGGIAWRQDGRELLYLTADQKSQGITVMAIDVEIASTFKTGAPRVLFTVPGPLPGNPRHWKHVSPDAQRFVFAIPVSR